jgi:WD40 repeat protein
MLATASLELKGEKGSAHDCPVLSVALSPKGNTIVSASGNGVYVSGWGSGTNTIKVWDAGIP